MKKNLLFMAVGLVAGVAVVLGFLLARNYREQKRAVDALGKTTDLLCAGSVVRVVYFAEQARRMEQVPGWNKSGAKPSYVVVTPEVDAKIREATPDFAKAKVPEEASIDSPEKLGQVEAVHALLKASAPEAYGYCARMKGVITKCIPTLTLSPPTEEEGRQCASREFKPVIEDLMAYLRRNFGAGS